MRKRRAILFYCIAVIYATIFIKLFFFSSCLDYTFTLLQCIAILLTFVIALFISLNFSPVLTPTITTKWIDGQNNLLLVKTEITNDSKVIAILKKNGIRLQILKQVIGEGAINEWVAFDECSVSNMAPRPITWNEPFNINTSSGHLYPGDSLKTERIFQVNLNKSELLHIGLQIKLSIGPLNFLHPEQWTTTCFVFREESQS